MHVSTINLVKLNKTGLQRSIFSPKYKPEDEMDLKKNQRPILSGVNICNMQYLIKYAFIFSCLKKIGDFYLNSGDANIHILRTRKDYKIN